MLRFIRYGQRWLVGAVVVLVGGVFALFIGLGQPLSPGSTTSVVEVGDRSYDTRDHARERRRQEDYFRQTLGEAFDAVGAGDQLDALAASTLVQRAILARDAERLGLRASEQEMKQIARRLFPDAETYRAYVEQEYGTETTFLRALRDDLLVQKLVHLLDAGVAVSEQEARESILRAQEEVRLAIVTLDTNAPPEDLGIGEEQIQQALIDRAEEIRSLYEERLDTHYSRPEQARASHILIELGRDADVEAEAAAQAEARELLRRLGDGEDFAELARSESDDDRTGPLGGDLGLLERGQLAEPLDEFVFANEPGTLSEPIRSDAGLHLVEVQERLPEQVQPLEDVKAELAREILESESTERYVAETSERLAEAVRSGRSLEEAARAEGLNIERTALLRRRVDGFVPGLGVAPEVLHTAFALSMEAPSSDRVFELGPRRALIQLLERRRPEESQIAEALPAERERLLAQKRAAFQSRWIEARRDALERAGRLRINLALLP